MGALGLGGGMLLREPGRARNRQFALLCLALALWTLGSAGSRLPQADPQTWRRILLLGSCSAAPLGLHFALVLAGTDRRVGRRLLAPAYSLAAALWLLNWTPIHLGKHAWATVAISVLGGILTLALGIMARHAFGLPRGPVRRAHLLVLAGGIIAAIGGISDFIPRSDAGFPRVGPIAMLIFLLLLCGVVARHRFFDIDALLVRGVALLAGAAAAGLASYGAIRLVDDSYATLFLTALLVLAIAGPAGKLLLSGARTLLGGDQPMASALSRVSRRLAQATTSGEVWQILEEGRRALPGDVEINVFVRGRTHRDFHRVFHGGRGRAAPGAIPHGSALPLLLASEGLPVTRRYLDQEAREAAGERARLAGEALEALDEARVSLAVPLLGGERLLGWIELGPGLAEAHLTAEFAAAFLAVANQAVASLDRIEAVEAARQKDELAAVGELAAGLAHEVRNPVAAIHGAAQALGPQATEAQRREMLQVIEEESARLDRVVGEFLCYARPSSPHPEPVDLIELVRRSVRGLELSGRRLAVEVQASPDVVALGDPDQLQRAIDNVVRNAWEAAGEGGRLRVQILAEPDGCVSARFEDSGPGIPPESIRKLCRPFYTTKPGGTGLGLALIERIVTAHGGDLRIDGRPGLGAAFTFVLPRAPRGGAPRLDPRAQAR